MSRADMCTTHCLMRLTIAMVALLGGLQEARPADAGPGQNRPIRFGTDVAPVLTRLGCNGGGCHGKATGQNGFKLSLLGFEPETDYEAIVLESRGRRIAQTSPHNSQLLLKATGAVAHGGGRALPPQSEDYRILLEWIAQGAHPPRPDDPTVTKIEISPPQEVLAVNERRQLLVMARFSDGSSRDVTRSVVYQSNEPDIASVDRDGLVRTGAHSGLFTIMARYGEQIATFHAAVPYAKNDAEKGEVNRLLDNLEVASGSPSFVDRLLMRQWRRLALVPSPPADDATFLRRVTIDICGTLPTVEEVHEYLNDRRQDKQAKLIDRLLERPEYAGYFALKWADILQNRGAGYSTSRQRPGTTLFSAWIRDSIAANKPYDQFVREILTASGSQRDHAPAIWYRAVRKTPDYVESLSQAFLGMRIQCAQCHHHPAERWSQADYHSLAAVFARVGRKGGFADAEVPTDEIIFLKESGDVKHPRTGELLVPRPPGGPDFKLARDEDPRHALAEWMTRRGNPFFARTMANRMWAHFLGRGIVHPIDDARSTNPPTNPELLDALADDFSKGGYDIKRLIRSICNSYAYRLQSASNPLNGGDNQSFARFYPRRLTAEALLDGVSQVLDVPTVFSPGPGNLPMGTRAIDLPDENVPAPFLDAFGRPGRMSSCECERVDAPALSQALELVNSQEIQRKLMAKEGLAARLAADQSPAEQRIQTVFMRTLGRGPRPAEREAAMQFLASEPDRREAWRSLLWSLLATNEFMFNH